MTRDPISGRHHLGKRFLTREDMDRMAEGSEQAMRQMEWMHRHPRLDAVRRFFGLPVPMVRT